MILPIKPFSINKAFQGRRFKTKEYDAWRADLLYRLPHSIEIKIDKESELCLIIEFGLSNKNSDLDNCVKTFQDALQIKYGFDDKQIHQLWLAKKKVKKGEEYIKWKIINAQQIGNLISSVS